MRWLVKPLTLVLPLLVLAAFATPAKAAWTSGAPGPARATAATLAPTGSASASCFLLLDPTVRVDWGASASPFAQYEVRWGTSKGGPYNRSSGVLTGRSWSSPGLGLGTYYFVVRSVKGNWTSGYSNEVSKTVISILFLGLACA